MLCLYYEFFTIYATALMSGHWVFAIKYIEVVLNLPMLIFPEKVDNFDTQLKRISRVVRTLNGIFATIILVYIFFMQLYIFGVWAGDKANDCLDILEIAMTLLPTVVLLAAVIKVRCMFRKLRNKVILQKETVILIHTVLFSLYFLLSIMGDIA